MTWMQRIGIESGLGVVVELNKDQKLDIVNDDFIVGEKVTKFTSCLFLTMNDTNFTMWSQMVVWW